MKKYLQFAIVFCFALLLLACASVQAPTEAPAEELPATEPPAVEVPVSTQLPQSVRVMFYFKNDGTIPEDWIQGYTSQQTIVFNRDSSGGWSTMDSGILLKDAGELFSTFTLRDLSNQNGECPINTYYIDRGNGFKSVQFQPLCGKTDSEEMATMTFGIFNCNKSSDGGLDCTKEYSDEFDRGVLHYHLNSTGDKLSFNYTGWWCQAFEEWINDSASKLDLVIPEGFFDQEFESGLDHGYTISK